MTDNGRDAICANCRWFAVEKLQPSGGGCRRHPPTAFQLVLPAQGSPLMRAGQTAMEVRYQGVFPPVEKTSWCGEFERKLDG